MPYTAFGTILAYGNSETPGEEYTKVGKVKDINGPSASRDTIDVTNHDSPDGYEEFLASLANGGEVTFPVEWDPEDASHDQTTGVYSLMEETVTRNWRLIFPIESTVTPGQYHGFQFKALVTGLSGPHGPVKGSVTLDVTLKVSGKPTQGTYAVTGLC
jgi:hypothetical protein